MEHEFKPFDRVLVRSFDNEEWQAQFLRKIDYSSLTSGAPVFIDMFGGVHTRCIPYEGNEHLVNTALDPTPKHEYKWGDKVEIRVAPDKWRKAICLGSIKEDHITYYRFIEDDKASYGKCTYKNIRPLQEGE